jgi:hypothetical protein
MTKKTGKVAKKCSDSCKKSCNENIHSINNQEFRYPSLIDRIKILMSQIFP